MGSIGLRYVCWLQHVRPAIAQKFTGNNIMAKSAPTDRKQVASDNGVLALTGAEILLKALESEGVEVIFGYPGGAVLPIYDALFKNNKKIGRAHV